ncbi:MAG: hypothetical protein PQJ59_16620 [Spirochaetales bacterium]|nr:hypothetical protein [Spirochaetales bacterium]
MNWNFHDGKVMVPAQNGWYEMRHEFMRNERVEWRDGKWYWENGEKIPDGICRWWR